MPKNFDQKIFWFPESYNHLRSELETHWNPRKTGQVPHHLLAPQIRWTDWQCGWAMAFDAENFVEYMNRGLDGVFRVSVVTHDDQLRIDHICSVFLKELRKRRGEPNP